MTETPGISKKKLSEPGHMLILSMRITKTCGNPFTRPYFAGIPIEVFKTELCFFEWNLSDPQYSQT